MKWLITIFFSVTLVAEENRYSAINKRNAFDLTSEVLPPASEILQVEAPKVELFLTGVTRWRGVTKAHLYSKDLPSKYLSLKAGEQSGSIKVLAISKDAVRIVNSGTEQVLTFASNRLKTTIISAKGKPTIVKKDSKKDGSVKITPAKPAGPNIVKVPSRSRGTITDPRMQSMMERGLEYLNKIEDPKKKEAMLERMEKFQRGDYDEEIKDRMKRYEEYRKNRDKDRSRDRKK